MTDNRRNQGATKYHAQRVVFDDLVPTRQSPVNHRLSTQGGQLGVSGDYSLPAWFGEGDPSACIANEHHAIRQTVGVIDNSRLTKVFVEGPDAVKALNWLSTNNCDVAVGTLVYTPWCDDHGTVIADVTVTRLADDRFLVLGTEMHYAMLAATIHHACKERMLDITITDRSEEIAAFSVQGPYARTLLSQLTTADLSNRSFPLCSAREITVVGVQVLALRITFTGELGWELHLPSEHAVEIYDALFEAGQDLDVRPVGFEALCGLATEAGYHELDSILQSVMTPLEANLGAVVNYDQANRFRGQLALESQLAGWPPPLRLAHVRLVDPHARLDVGAPVKRFGITVGTVTLSAYGHGVGAAVGFVELTNSDGISDEWIAAGYWTIGTEGEPIQALVSTKAWFDPLRLRVNEICA